jgi:hypothetical protein
MMSQNRMLATERAHLLSAEVPGVTVLLSPWLLNDAACCWGGLERVGVCAEECGLPCREGSADRHAAERRGVQFCCEQLLQECIPAWSSTDRLAPVEVFEMSAQKSPTSLQSVSIGRPQISVSPMPAVFATPGTCARMQCSRTRRSW